MPTTLTDTLARRATINARVGQSVEAIDRDMTASERRSHLRHVCRDVAAGDLDPIHVLELAAFAQAELEAQSREAARHG